MKFIDRIFKVLQNRKWLFFFLIATILLCGLGLGFILDFFFRKESHIKTGAVVSNGRGCAQIGSRLLRDGGSAADAAIGVLLCEGVHLPQSMGVGGGFVATIYDRSTRKVEALIARETAPAAADKDMFVGQKHVVGAKACAVPSEMLGYYELHKKYGRLPWRKLFQPTIDLCKNHRASGYLAEDIKRNVDTIKTEPTLAEIFLQSNGEPLREGQIAKRSMLCATLQRIADFGIEEMYGGGQVGKMFIEDVREMGGLLTEEDLRNYRVRWDDKGYIETKLTDDGLTLYTSPLPTSGILVAFMLNVIRGFRTKDDEVYWQRITETFKHAYGHRSSLGDKDGDPEVQAEVSELLNKLQDPEFVRKIRNLIHDNETSQDFKYYGAQFANIDDKGTANLAVLAPDGDAITVTSTINNEFGSKMRSRRTGIILNDEMDDFSTPGVVNAYGIPASPVNFIKPGKRPMSSMCPSIILDKDGNVRMLVGAAGGSKITTSVVGAIVKYVFLKQNLRRAVDDSRLHHQLAPMELLLEADFPKSIKNYLEKVGHKVVTVNATSFTALTAIGVMDGAPVPYYDKRRIGSKAVVSIKT